MAKPEVRMIFEDNAAWDQHLREIRAEKAKAWAAGYEEGLTTPWNSEGPYNHSVNPFAGDGPDCD